MIRLVIASCFVWLCFQSAALAQDTRFEARIGVLAYRGSENLEQKWASLRNYLNAAVPEWSFQIVPVTLRSASEQIQTGQLDFIITNPGHFVELSRKHRMSALASRTQQKSDGSYSGAFGSALIALKGSGIQQLQDIAGKSVQAVDLNAFGGFQLAWLESEGAGVDLFADTARLDFVGFPMDQIVWSVLAGKADVGIVRSGLIESLAQEGKVDPDQLVFLNANVTFSHPDRVSTQLYSEWPFAALMTTSPELKNEVVIALLTAKDSQIARDAGLKDYWSAPVSYLSAEEVTDAFQTRMQRMDATGGFFAPFLNWSFVALSLALVLSVAFWQKARMAHAGLPGAAPEANKTDAVHLTNREREIVDLVAKGLSTKEIAIDLGISPKTVEFHRSNLLKKFGAKTSSQLIALAT